MPKTLILFCFLLSVFHSACSQDSTRFKLGDSTVRIVTRCESPCNDSISFINLHENESTSIDAAQAFLREYSGQLIQLKQSGKRNILFRQNKRLYTFDPNRIFTPIGRKETLTNLSTYNIKAAMEIQPLAEEILKKYVDGKKLVIALHNNTDTAYSILSYTVLEQEGINAEKIFINEAMDIDDFIITTDSTIFKLIQEKDINVVLQSKNPRDDGSLSVYAYNKRIPYINVEAQHGHVEEQTRMMFALKEIIALFVNGVPVKY